MHVHRFSKAVFANSFFGSCQGCKDNSTLKSFYYEPGNLFLKGNGVCLGKQRQESTTEIMSVAVRKPELIGDSIQEQVSTYNHRKHMSITFANVPITGRSCSVV